MSYIHSAGSAMGYIHNSGLAISMQGNEHRNYRFNSLGRIIAIIPARMKSKGIPNKNLSKYNGSTLVELAIESALESRYIDNIILSSESDKILSYVNKYPRIHAHKRPVALSADHVQVDEVGLFVLREIQRYTTVGTVVMLQPTSPERTVEDIDGAIEEMIDIEYGSVMSVVVPEKFFYTNRGAVIEPLGHNNLTRRGRQWIDWRSHGVYMENGAVYVCRVSDYEEQKTFRANPVHPYVMDTYVEID